MKIQIKNCFDLSVIFECEADSMKLAVELAIKSGANLYGEKIDKIPIQLSGLKWWINITKKHIQIGCQVHEAEKWFKFKDSEIEKMHSEALVFWKANKKLIKQAWLHHCKD